MDCGVSQSHLVHLYEEKQTEVMVKDKLCWGICFGCGLSPFTATRENVLTFRRTTPY